MQNLSYAKIVEIKKIASNFCICDGEITHVIPINVGKTNATYKIVVSHDDDTTSYMLQKINTKVFKNVDLMMSNAIKVTEHLRRKGFYTLEFVLNKNDNSPIYKISSGTYRMTKFIHAEVFQTISRPKDMQMLGTAVGNFLVGVSDFNTNELEDTIPNFHNTRNRFDDCILSALNYMLNNEKEKINRSREDLNFVIKNHSIVGIIVDALERGDIPTRITHNDTKISNVLFDRKTNTPRCMIDLDTVMRGSPLYDIADAIRSGANTHSGQEREYKKARIDLELLKEFLIGFEKGAPGMLNEKEKELLPVALKIIPLELGMRYLTDYYNGNKYFNVSYEDQNLYRARLQFAIVKDINSNLGLIREVIDETIS